MLGWLLGRDEKLFGASRSPKWSKVRSQFLINNPICSVCGKKDKLEVHHKKPFHLYPELELDTSNLMTLCDSPCHLIFGHCGNWSWYRDDVDEFCKAERELRLKLKGSGNAV